MRMAARRKASAVVPVGGNSLRGTPPLVRRGTERIPKKLGKRPL